MTMYRLFEGGYEGFLDDRVPAEYKDIVVDKLPQSIIDAEKAIEQEIKEKADYVEAMPNLVKNMAVEIESLKSKVKILEAAKEIAK